MTTTNTIQTAADSLLFMDERLVVERSDVRVALGNPKEARTHAFQEEVL